MPPNFANVPAVTGGFWFAIRKMRKIANKIKYIQFSMNIMYIGRLKQEYV